MSNSLNSFATAPERSVHGAEGRGRMTPELRAALKMLRAMTKDARERLERLIARDIRHYQITAKGLVDLTPASIAEAETELAEAEQTLARFDQDGGTAED